MPSSEPQQQQQQQQQQPQQQPQQQQQQQQPQPQQQQQQQQLPPSAAANPGVLRSRLITLDNSSRLLPHAASPRASEPSGGRELLSEAETRSAPAVPSPQVPSSVCRTFFRPFPYTSGECVLGSVSRRLQSQRKGRGGGREREGLVGSRGEVERPLGYIARLRVLTRAAGCARAGRGRGLARAERLPAPADRHGPSLRLHAFAPTRRRRCGVTAHVRR
jgi:hypothetical protein